MWAIELQGSGASTLVETERPVPQPAAGEVLVRVGAASLNYRDLALVRGGYDAGQQYPFVPLSDGAGEIVAAGDGVTRFAAGDRVAFVTQPEWRDGKPTRRGLDLTLGAPLPGVLAEYRLAREDDVVRTPAHLTDAQASTLPIAGVTAWTALVTDGRVRAGEWVAVQGTGGVSLIALQLAHRLGARTILLSSSDAKLERGRALGADHVINYVTTPEWQHEVVAITGGEGADHVIDVGGASTLAKSVEAIRPGGTVYVIGFVGGKVAELQLRQVIGRAAVLRGLSIGPRSAFEELNAAIAEWQLEPVVDRVFKRTDVAAAFDYLASGAHFGKVVVDFAP